MLEETDFDDSTVLKYLCGQVGGSGGGDGATSTKTATEGAGRVVSLRVLDPRRPLSASGLSTIYTMHFCRGGAAGGGGRGGNRRTAVPSLLAAGGKGGVVALFSTQRSQVSLLACLPASDGWVVGGEGGAYALILVLDRCKRYPSIQVVCHRTWARV